jgi:hypothetical protein
LNARRAETERRGGWNKHHAWRLFIERLGRCLDKACAIRAGEHGATDEAAANELAELLVGVFCVSQRACAPR